MSLGRIKIASMSLLLILLAGCSRQGAPAQLSFSLSKTQGFSLDGEVNFIAVNISGGGNRLQSHQWECERNPCDQLSVETLSGPDKLIQLLLVVDKSDGSTDVLYGDATVSISAGDNRVEIQLNKIADFNQEGSAAGRYIPTVNHPLAGRFLTGRVSIWARVGLNKPDMRIQETSIFGGWFRVFLLDTLGFRYTFSGHDFQGNPYVEVPIFNDLHDSSGLRLSSAGLQPAGTRSVRYSSTLPYFDERGSGVVEQRSFETQNIGFFGANPDGSRLCSESMSPGFAFSGSNSSSRLCKNSTCSNFFVFSDITVLGGINGSSNLCAGAAAEKKLNLNRIADEEELLEAFGPFVSNSTAKAFVLDVTNQRVRWRLAPRTFLPRGVELMVRNNSQPLDWNAVWDAMGPDDGIDCGSLANYGFTSLGVYSGDGNVDVSNLLNPETTFALCPRRPIAGYYPAGVLFPRQDGRWEPTRLSLQTPVTLGPSAQATVSTSVCHPLLLKTVDEFDREAHPDGSVDVSITLTGGALFANQSDCQMGTPQLGSTFTTSNSRALIWLRNGASSGAFSVTVNDADGDLDPGYFNYTVATPGPLVSMRLIPDFFRADVFERAVTESCIPFHLIATDANGRLVNFAAGNRASFHDPGGLDGVHEFQNCLPGSRWVGFMSVSQDRSVQTYSYKSSVTAPGTTISNILNGCEVSSGVPVSGQCVSPALQSVAPGPFSHFHVQVIDPPSYSNSSCMRFRLGAYDRHRPNAYPVQFGSVGALPSFEVDAYNAGTTDPFPGAEYFTEPSANATCSAGGSLSPISITPLSTDVETFFQIRPNGSGSMDVDLETSDSSWEAVLNFFINI